MKTISMVMILFLSVFLVACSTQSEGDKYYGAKYRASDHSPGTSVGYVSEENVESSSELGGLALELSKHNTISECWIAYGNAVYDITSYLQMNPDSELQTYCGTDAFETVVDSYNIKFSDVEAASMYKGSLK
ncbi:MAG TPA: cytochrome b5 domain-containing protein [Alphaproteobacteria bacterium]|nr:cytochrome b5 domain-containing protein [Alphaproteobacteria bacterium]